MSKNSLIHIIVAISAITMIVYFTWIREVPTPPPLLEEIPFLPPLEIPVLPPVEVPIPPGGGVWIPREEEIIRVLFPRGGEKLEIGKTYEIGWENYIGNEPLTIALQVTTPEGRVYANIIAENIPAAPSGTYKWTVTSERLDSKYKIEVYPPANRPLVGQSKNFFFIIGDPLIIVDSPQPFEEVTSPLKVTGKARGIFSEAEFLVRLVSYWFPDRPLLAEAIARAHQDCDWLAGDWCDFKAELSFPPEKITGRWTKVKFYQRDEQLGERLIYQFPVVGKR